MGARSRSNTMGRVMNGGQVRYKDSSLCVCVCSVLRVSLPGEQLWVKLVETIVWIFLLCQSS